VPGFAILSEAGGVLWMARDRTVARLDLATWKSSRVVGRERVRLEPTPLPKDLDDVPWEDLMAPSSHDGGADTP